MYFQKSCQYHTYIAAIDQMHKKTGKYVRDDVLTLYVYLTDRIEVKVVEEICQGKF